MPRRIAILERDPDIDIVLMDIMMPVMDGYETMRADPRASSSFDTLPIIAVTGKVMAGERQRCLDAGANDYVPKPVDTAELLVGRSRRGCPTRGRSPHERRDGHLGRAGRRSAGRGGAPRCPILVVDDNGCEAAGAEGHPGARWATPSSRPTPGWPRCAA